MAGKIESRWVKKNKAALNAEPGLVLHKQLTHLA